MKLTHMTSLLALAGLAGTGCMPDEGKTLEGSTDATTSTADTATPVADTALADTGVPTPTVTGLVVHEWGTFTSVQDADGVSHPGLHHEDEELPGWVNRRDLGPNAYFEELPEEPLQQLETPVLYFHADKAMDVSVHVDFPQGIISQWYPSATAYAPAPYTMTAIAAGNMDWNVEIDPDIDPAKFAPVDPKEIWAPSRQVRSTPVRFQAAPVAGAEDVPASPELEQFIFYRGLGNFDLPVRVKVPNDNLVQIRNDSQDDLSAVVILNAAADGSGAVSALGALAAGAKLDATVPKTMLAHEAYLTAAHAALKQAVVATGLFDDEAEAMVNTWTRSWFGNVGVRVLYVVPRAWTDRLLPIRISPAPDALVRTLVGRIEVMTPADESATWAAIQGLGDAPQWDALEKVTDDLGRFAEPRILQALAAHGVVPDGMGSSAGDQLLYSAHQRP